MELFTFNYLAILAATIASVICGGAYVNIFSKQWAKLNGFTQAQAKQKQKANPKGMIGIVLANLFMAFGIAYFVSILNIRDFLSAVPLMMWLFVGFIGPLTIGPVLWEGKPLRLWMFSNVINIICLAVMTLILTYWR